MLTCDENQFVAFQKIDSECGIQWLHLEASLNKLLEVVVSGVESRLLARLPHDLNQLGPALG